MQPNLTSFVVLCIVLVAMGFGLGFLVAFLEFRGPLGDGEAARVENAKQLRNNMKADNVGSHLSALTVRPNTAGTSTGSANVDELMSYFEEQGFSVRVDSYDVLLSFPDRSEATNQAVLLDGNKEVLRQMPEKITSAAARRIARSPGDDVTNTSAADKTRLDDVAYPYIAYSSSGSVEGDVMYANFGEQEDLDWLGTSVSGKILLERYGRNSIAEKVQLAEDRGAVALLLFADPIHFAQGNVTYPKNWWLPPDAAHWGTAFADGDPLTPGVAAIDGVDRRDPADSGLPKILVFSISYSDAGALLGIMNERPVPPDWQGGLSQTYKVGPGFSNAAWKVKIDITMVTSEETISNVIGIIDGDEEADRYVMIGGAIDSWGTGGVGASGGTAVLMEVARTLGDLKKGGWKPRRTIMLCGWDAMEFGDIGLIEWLEEYSEILSDRVVAYIDISNPVEGTYAPKLVASAIVEKALREAAKKVPNPCEEEVKAGRDHVYDTLEFMNKEGSPDMARSATAKVREMLGAATSEIRYSYDDDLNIPHYPLYHTKYDTFETMKTLIDPGFKYHLAISQWVGEAALLLADKPLLSYDVSKYAEVLDAQSNALTSGIQGLDDTVQQQLSQDLDRYNEAVEEFTGVTLPEFQEKTKHSDPTKPLVMRQVNDQMMALEKTFSKPAADDERSLFALSTVQDYIQPLNASTSSIPANEKAELVEDLDRYIFNVTMRIDHAIDVLRKPTEF